MEKTFKNFKPKKHILFLIAIIVTFLLLCILGGVFYHRSSLQLYDESISQLDELSNQLYEKLDIQIELQWDYLDKFNSELKNHSTLTEEELKNVISHYENDFTPTGSSGIIFYCLDSEGYFYDNDGRQGYWNNNNNNNNIDKAKDRQSFLFSSKVDYNENYMAFIEKLDSSLSVDGNTIERIILLRSMDDMKEFFHSTAFKNNSATYIVDDYGTVLFSDSTIENISFAGTNIYKYLNNQSFLHYNNFDEVRKENKENDKIVCTDLKADNTKFFIIFDQIAEYDWGMLILVNSNVIAKDTSEVVNSVIIMFLTLALILLIAVILTFIFIGRIKEDKNILQLKTENEQALSSANIQLEKSQKETEHALSIANQATKAKSQFLANMSHDIRTPMNAIVGVSKLMEYEADNPEKIRYYVGKLRHTSQYMLGLINDILDMSKIESGEVNLSVDHVKMAEQAGQIESIIRSQCNEKNQDFSVIVHNIQHEYLLGDSVRLRQVFINLLSNAVKYTQEGGKIVFEIAEQPCEEEGYATIITSVIDNGYGMSEEFQKHMFDPFAREENSTTNKVQGTGLGLSITKSIVDLMGGTISVQSKLNEGSRFDVALTLPIDTEPINTYDLHDVLLLASDDVIIDNVKASLSNANIETRVAKNVEDATLLLQNKPVDIILISGCLKDNMLKDTVKKIRSACTNSAFVFCCDYAHRSSIRDMLLSSGIDGLITRPFFLENLLTALKNAEEDKTEKQKENTSPLSGKRFLCAEDNELNAEILEALLSMHGATCKIYPNGDELVKAFIQMNKGDFDAVLMDVQMPIKNGIDATIEIRQSNHPLAKTFPIIAMTANAFSSDVEDCLAAGMNAHLAKPLDITALERILNELL